MNWDSRIIFNKEVTKEKKHYIYCHFEIDNNYPFYVGIGTNSKYRTFSRAKSASGRNKFWREKIKEKCIIVICSESDDYNEIKELEKEFIELYGIESLTNMTHGGEGCVGYKHTEEHINKLRENYKKGKSGLSNREITYKERILKSRLYSGEGNPNYNNRGFKSKTGKRVYKISKDDRIVETFGSIRNAAVIEGVSHTSIRKAIVNNRLCNNYKWEYVK